MFFDGLIFLSYCDLLVALVNYSAIECIKSIEYREGEDFPPFLHLRVFYSNSICIFAVNCLFKFTVSFVDEAISRDAGRKGISEYRMIFLPVH